MAFRERFQQAPDVIARPAPISMKERQPDSSAMDVVKNGF
jgi:hypothetical protein